MLATARVEVEAHCCALLAVLELTKEVQAKEAATLVQRENIAAA